MSLVFCSPKNLLKLEKIFDNRDILHCVLEFMITVVCKHIVVFLFLSVIACAEVPKNMLPLAEVEGEPSAIIAGCVNVITGNYNDAQTDMVVPGPDPLVFQRLYSSGNWKGSGFKDGWSHNHATKGKIFLYPPLLCYCACLPEPSGGTMLYFSNPGIFRANDRGNVYHPSKAELRTFAHGYLAGLANTGSGEISGRTNVKNQFLTWRPDTKFTVAVELPNGW